jgi:methylglutaconyl-CoA hydratase
MKSLIQIRVDPPSGTIILDRPGQANAITRYGLEQLKQALEDLRQQKSIRAVILTGSGPVFSAGTDLVELEETRSDADCDLQWQADAVCFQEVLMMMLRFPKPIIAALNGPARGTAAGLVLACDMVIAAESASLGFPEVKLGLVAGVSAPLLRFRIGAARAARLLLGGQPLAASEMHRQGLACEVVTDDLVWARAHEMASEMEELVPEAITMTKRLLNETLGESLATEMSVGAALMATARTTEFARQGLEKWREGRGQG